MSSLLADNEHVVEDKQSSPMSLAKVWTTAKFNHLSHSNPQYQVALGRGQFLYKLVYQLLITTHNNSKINNHVCGMLSSLRMKLSLYNCANWHKINFVWINHT